MSDWQDWDDLTSSYGAADGSADNGCALPRPKVRVGPQVQGHPIFDVHPPAWMDKGLCASHPQRDEWFPDNGLSAVASAVCRRCPVMRVCAAYAQDLADHGQNPVGIWGDTTTNQRKQRRTKKKAA